MSDLNGWYKLVAIMPASPGAMTIRDKLSRRADRLDDDGIKIGDIRNQEFLSGFVTQPGGKFVASYVTDNLQHIADAAAEPSITMLFVQDMGNGLHLGETYEWDNTDPENPVRNVVGTPTYTPHPAYEDFMLGGLTKARAFHVNDMFGVPR